MAIKREIAYGIVQGLSEFWTCDELKDFTVTVGETQFGCHKLLLASCSGFFRALFRSGMKEAVLNCATLEEISSETFQLVLEAIYTGRGILTKDNVIDIWRAAHQLQVIFMVTECEMFVLNTLSIDNYIQYFQCGRLLSSEIVIETVYTFILKHCSSFFKTSYFLELPFNEVLMLTKSQDLAPRTEDEVLKAILKWVEYTPEKELQNNANSLQVVNNNIYTMSQDKKRIKGSDTNSEDLSEGNSMALCLKDNKTFNKNVMSCDNRVPYLECVPSNKTGLCDGTPTESDNRKKHLFELVSNTRTCLVGHGCLEIFLSHPLVSENKQTRDVITRAILYQLQIDKRNGQWPTGATHRNKSEHENVAIAVNNGCKLMVYSFSKNNWSKFKLTPLCDHEMIIQMITVGKSLYSLCVRYEDFHNHFEFECPFFLYVLTESNRWAPIHVSLEMLNIRFSVVAVSECIYIAQMRNFWKLNPFLPSVVSLCDLPADEPICHLTCYDKNILAFYSVFAECGVEETAILRFDTLNNTWAQLKNLDGPAYGMTSFKDDHSTYLLKSNGDLWKLVKPQSDVVDFELAAKLWHCYWPLHGAVIFLDELYLYGVDYKTITDDPLRLKSLAGLFKKITYLQSHVTCYVKAMFVPFIAERKMLLSM